jgi:carboxyl-terminal processing protease
LAGVLVAGSLVAIGASAASAPSDAGPLSIDPWQREFTAEAYRAELTRLEGQGGSGAEGRMLASGVEMIEVDDLLVRGAASDVARAALNADAVVLDLRGSRGGLVTEAVDVAGVFLGDGRGLAYERADGTSRTLGLPDDGVEMHGPLVVLVDERTASAAEALAGMLRDHGRAVVVGEPTFGKGSVQEPVVLDDGRVLRSTVGRYVLPSGGGIGPDGLTPDVIVEDASVDAAVLDVAERVLSGLATAEA